MPKKITAHKHSDNRAHIPSKEEAGYEAANPAVADGAETLELDKNPSYMQHNPIDHRGRDPELWWLGKYGPDNANDHTSIDIRSLYRHEHIAPEALMSNLYKVTEQESQAPDLFSSANELFGNALDHDELEKVSEYYQHSDGWSNRLIQGDSLLVMSSLLEREGMAGQVQCIYIDPPYGIKYGGNWQMKLNDRNVKDGNDDHLSGEPEMIKAYRDTWELGIHSYLSYLRDRLLVAKELLTESGSCFVQISDENVHLVRCLMDEVFGSENFVSLISFSKTGGLGSRLLYGIFDYIIWYGKDADHIKYRQLFEPKTLGGSGSSKYNSLREANGTTRTLSRAEKENPKLVPQNAQVFRLDNLTSQGNEPFDFTFEGRNFTAGWKTNLAGLEKLAQKDRIKASKNSLNYVRFLDDFPAYPINNYWSIGGIQNRSDGKIYVVQTAAEAIKRCLLMTTDPGDLVLDPTCGSGTTAYVAEQWGRRWITVDTSRIALNIAKTRLTTATFPHYYLYSDAEREVTEDKNGRRRFKAQYKPEAEQAHDIRQGFLYETVPHITLKSLANDEPPAEETLYDKPLEDKKRLRVAGPFTVETLQNYEPAPPESLTDGTEQTADSSSFEQRVFAHLKDAGVKNGMRNEQAIFIRVERLADAHLHAEGFYLDAEGNERKAYFHIGPKFGTVARQAVNSAVKACRTRGDADWLVVLGFSFESNIANDTVTQSVGSFEVTKARMHDDLMQDGLRKKPGKSAASFVTIGEPDVRLKRASTGAAHEHVVEIAGLDIYDPIKDLVKARNVEDIAYWMVDTDYDGSNFVVRQLFFCGGKKDEFKKWRKGLDMIARDRAKKNVEQTLKIEIDDEAFARLYGMESHPFELKEGQQVAVRVVSQFGEESMKILGN